MTKDRREGIISELRLEKLREVARSGDPDWSFDITRGEACRILNLIDALRAENVELRRRLALAGPD